MCTFMDLVRFIGQDGTHWLGSLIFMAVGLHGLAGIIRAARGMPEED